jgi:hypothetical protein
MYPFIVEERQRDDWFIYELSDADHSCIYNVDDPLKKVLDQDCGRLDNHFKVTIQLFDDNKQPPLIISLIIEIPSKVELFEKLWNIFPGQRKISRQQVAEIVTQRMAYFWEIEREQDEEFKKLCGKLSLDYGLQALDPRWVFGREPLAFPRRAWFSDVITVSWMRGKDFGDAQGGIDEKPYQMNSPLYFKITKNPITREELFKGPIDINCNFSAKERNGLATNLSWKEARAFSRHLGGDLPTEIEWEAAARSFPNFFRTDLWEWCANAYGPPGQIYTGDDFDGHRVIRGGPEGGGSGKGKNLNNYLWRRHKMLPDLRMDEVGFRCVFR